MARGRRPQNRPSLVQRPNKYYQDLGHVDVRFSRRISDRRSSKEHAALQRLVTSFSLTSSDLGLTSWLAHGSLLGWYWGQHIFPWDVDLDVHVSLASLEFLASYYNMTVYTFRFPDLAPSDPPAMYLLDINPFFRNRTVDGTGGNMIDARWIDMQTGFFIDITALHTVDIASTETGEPHVHLQAKDGHTYLIEEVFPLQAGVFEGVHICLPKFPQTLLAREYGLKALTTSVFHGHQYEEESETWTQLKPQGQKGP